MEERGFTSCVLVCELVLFWFWFLGVLVVFCLFGFDFLGFFGGFLVVFFVFSNEDLNSSMGATS